jgi:four helix bundle protein
MSTITGFEDLIAWQKARILARRIYVCTRNPVFSKDYGLANQIQRAATSIMANIAEGFERDGRPEFFHFLTIARASCGEVKSHLYLAFDNSYLTKPDFDELLALTIEVSRILTGLRTAIRRQRDAQHLPSPPH